MKKIINLLQQTAFLFLFLFINALVTDIVIIKSINDWLIIIIIILWLAVILGFRLESRFSFALSLFFWLVSCFFVLLKLDLMAEKAAVWTYFLLCFGVVQKISEIKNIYKPGVDLSIFACSLINKLFFK